MRKAVLVLMAITVTLVIVISIFFLMDSDEDGMSNLAEILLGTEFGNPDTDGDGLSDGAEVSTYRTNPLLIDTDNDGLSDKIELGIHGTNPLAADTDNDGLSDGLEITDYGTNPLSVDTDSDNLSDWSELFTYGTDPLLADTDNDGLNDFLELNIHGTNPLDSDSDNDKLLDGQEVSGWTITVNSSPVKVTSDPLSVDSDGDNLSDWAEYNTYLSNPRATDTDGDGLSDRLEVLYNTNLSDALSVAQQIENAPAYPYLFLEIDYMSGYAPSPAAISYLESYFEYNLGVAVEVVHDEITYGEFTAVGVSPESISLQELNIIEAQFHDNPTTHLYVFYASAFDEKRIGGWASDTFGATLSGEYVSGNIARERTFLLHEVGHCLGLEHCDNSICVMQMAAIFENPIYCNSCWNQRNLLDVWSVDEPWT